MQGAKDIKTWRVGVGNLVAEYIPWLAQSEPSPAIPEDYLTALDPQTRLPLPDRRLQTAAVHATRLEIHIA